MGVDLRSLNLEANILINRDGRACIADFGLLTIVPDQTSFISTTCMEGGTIRWMSPELLDPEPFGLNDGRPTKESDCYALGMVIYEVLSGQVPFAQDKDTVVIRKVIEGKRPERPLGTQAVWFTDGLWEMLELCWNHQPCDRPSLKTLLQRLEVVTRPSRSSFLTTTTNGDLLTGTNNLSDPTVTNLEAVQTSLATSNTKQPEIEGSNLDGPPLPHLGPTAIPSTPCTKPLPPTPSKPPLAQPSHPRILQ